jgi:hypothetical protein
MQPGGLSDHEIGESAQVIEVGRPGLEPGTYGLKVEGASCSTQRFELVL